MLARKLRLQEGDAMRVLIIGGTGTIGSKAAAAFEELGDEVITVGRSTEVSVDLEDLSSITEMFNKVGRVDAVATTTGSAPFVSIEDATADNFQAGISSKMLAQLNAVVYCLPYLNDGGSITMTTGILTQHPVPGSLIATAANAGVEGFVRAAVSSLPRSIRINAVSPTMLKEARKAFGPSFVGFKPVSGTEVAQGYVRSAHGIESGQILQIWG